MEKHGEASKEVVITISTIYGIKFWNGDNQLIELKSDVTVNVSEPIKNELCSNDKSSLKLLGKEYFVSQQKLCIDCRLSASCLRKRALIQVIDAMKSIEKSYQ